MTDRAQEMKGRAKQAAGDLTDDPELKREGQADQAGAKAKDKVDEAADKAKDGLDKLTGKAKDSLRDDR
jgi:uncharacterized protein YjbJ (UPF0337 family)